MLGAYAGPFVTAILLNGTQYAVGIVIYETFLGLHNEVSHLTIEGFLGAIGVLGHHLHGQDVTRLGQRRGQISGHGQLQFAIGGGLSGGDDALLYLQSLDNIVGKCLVRRLVGFVVSVDKTVIGLGTHLQLGINGIDRKSVV